MGSMQITRYGHAALLVETQTTRILIDPGAFSADETFTLTGLDAIIVTHQHPDHLDPQRAASLVEANPNAMLLCDPQTASIVEFGEWNENGDGRETTIGDLTVTGVGAEHAVILPEIPRIANIGLLIRDGEGKTLFHPGDTYANTPAEVDVLAVPLSAPWAKVSETVAFVQAVAPSIVFPIHDRTIADVAYPLYWGQVAQHGGVDDARLVGQRDAVLDS